MSVTELCMLIAFKLRRIIHNIQCMVRYYRTSLTYSENHRQPDMYSSHGVLGTKFSIASIIHIYAFSVTDSADQPVTLYSEYHGAGLTWIVYSDVSPSPVVHQDEDDIWLCRSRRGRQHQPEHGRQYAFRHGQNNNCYFCARKMNG